MMKNKERLRNCPRSKETKENKLLNAMWHSRLDCGSEKMHLWKTDEIQMKFVCQFKNVLY